MCYTTHKSLDIHATETTASTHSYMKYPIKPKIIEYSSIITMYILILYIFVYIEVQRLIINARSELFAVNYWLYSYLFPV